MTVQQSLDLSEYVRILEYNGRTEEEIGRLKQEYISYIDNTLGVNLSEELKWYLNYLNNKREKENHTSKER